MKEIVLQHFFEGHATVEELSADVTGAFTRHVDSAGTVFSQLNCIDMSHEFAVLPTHIAKLVDAVLAGDLSLDGLDAICFALEASDSFSWDTDTPDGERVAESLFWLGTPEINYALSPVVLNKIRLYLLTGENTLGPEDVGERGTGPHLLTVNRKQVDRDV